ncbi:sugar transferase [Zhihengliuella somnathii]
MATALAHRVFIWDAISIVVAVVVAHLIRFGPTSDVPLVGSRTVPTYEILGGLLILLWWLALRIWNSYDSRILGEGSEEYKRVIAASLYLFGGLALFSYALQIDTARGYVGIALPLGLVLLVIGRWTMRKYLLRQRAQGRYTRQVLLIGRPSAVAHLSTSFRSAPGAGYRPAGAIVDEANNSGLDLDVPILGYGHSVESITRVLDTEPIDTVAISASSDLDPPMIRRLSWELQAREVYMIMAPALTDVGGARIYTQPVAGLPLIHVATPQLEGINAVAKRCSDVLFSSLGLLVLAPLFAVVAILIRIDDSGPVFFHQRRIGKDGQPFSMHKFRSMVVDAEKRLEALQARSEGNGVLFKMKSDPRITRVGAFIRRYSIDELPQLWNVLKGEMSLVGPRPPLPQEVETYEDFVHRRLMVTPGITGLWQVSGRSDLSWDESIRLDLYYVENWSLTQDFIIILKTAKAVLGKSGAY